MRRSIFWRGHLRNCRFSCLILAVLEIGLGVTTAGDRPLPRTMADITYPPSPAIVDVTKAPYFARGDGQSDDTAAVQQALSDVVGRHLIVYFPQGTYLISRTLRWSKRNTDGREAWGHTFLQGQSPYKATIRLKDGTFSDPDRPQSMMWCGGFGSADWFHNYVQGLTFDVGENNPGAIGLQFYSNNSGAVRDCRFVAAEGSGLVGLDLGHAEMNGPLLVRNCEVIGFKRGISTAGAVNGQTFERIAIRRQREVGFENAGQAISVRQLHSENAVPAVRTYGTFCLMDATLTGLSGADRWPAIVNYNHGRIFLRDVKTTAYGRALGDVTTPDWFAAARITGGDKAGSLGPTIDEYCSHPTTSPFPSESGSLRLPVKEPPEEEEDDPTKWADVDRFGADPTGRNDSSQAIQAAIDSGASTVFLPGTYDLVSTVLIRGKVRRLVGAGGIIKASGTVRPDFTIGDGASPFVTLEHFAQIQGGIQVDSKRTCIFRSVADCDLEFTPRAEEGELFFEDFVTHSLRLRKQRVWARQLNVENEGTHIVNDGGRFWALGYKTERGGTILETRLDGQSEIFGGFSYTTTAGMLAPMFVTDNSSVFTFFGEVCYTGDPFAVLIRETRNGTVRTVNRGEGSTAPYTTREAQR